MSATCNCGREATKTDERNGAARCERYPNCDRITRALEASGIDVGNVKDGEG